MSISQLARQLLTQDIFRGLTPLQLTEIVRQADRVVFSPGETIIESDTEGDAAVVVVAGEAVRLDDDETTECIEVPIDPGSLLGEMAMLIDHVHTATVVARGQVRALRITRDTLERQMLDDPTLAEHFVARITDRLHAVADELRRIDAHLAATMGEPALAH